MPKTARCTAEITVGLPADRAMSLFTAEGEREWAGDGWDPHYPAAERRGGPGAVFTTEHGHRTTWVMVDHHPEAIRYARVTEGVSAGTVAVDLVASDANSTRVRVTYDLTALSAAGERHLEAFEAGYDAEIASWAGEIARALDRRAPA
jgi:hypothetical protein